MLREQAKHMDARDQCSSLNKSSCAAGVVHTSTYNSRIMPQLRWCRGRPRHHVNLAVLTFDKPRAPCQNMTSSKKLSPDDTVDSALLAATLRGIFALAAMHRNGDYCKAARSQGVDLSTFWRRIDTLEKTLAVPLVEKDRATKKLTMTPGGRRIGKVAHKFLRALEYAIKG